ncbi:unnamed protein product [Rhizophagus irregularis]|uniref:Zinc finger bed domain-containing protein 1-like n=1 Tax=Rhizophagus irregularis TaxID=588596 RepID=A0A915YNJ1_9GLOM|nr:unnamed protein product [Rhizophagus irregularis]
MPRIFIIDEVIWDYLPDTVSEFSDIDSTFNNISTGSNRAPLTTPSAPSSTDSLDIKNQLHAAKKVKLYKSKRKYTKTNCVWQYMIQDNEYDICKVLVINMQNKKICCSQRFLHNRSTENMANHLCGKYSIYEGINKAKVIPHKESRNQEIRQAIAEWITIDNLPINVIQGKGYRKMITTLNPAFLIPSNKRIKKEINTGYTNAIEELKILLGNTCESASLTTDLWTAKSKHGYIRVTLHWLSEDFQVYDCLLCMERMQYPHTGTNIVFFLKKKVAEFGLEGKITCVVTDNGSNMVNVINQWDGVERLPCTAHTLQLSINHAFQKTNIYIKRIKRLVHFFTSFPKQSEHLDNAQKKCQRYKNTSLQDISDNSNDDSDDDDGMNEQPFEDATIYFSGTSYATLSIIYPLIQVLKFKYAENNEVNDDNLELEQDASNFQHEESDKESDLSDSDEEDNSKLDTPEQSTTHYHQIRSKAAAASTIQLAQDILKIMKQTIYNSLFVYWNEPIMIGLLASLLDPCLKTLSNWDEETRNKAKIELMHQFKELIDLNLIQSSPSGSLSQQRHHSQLHSFIFGVQVTANPFSELESYLDPICIPIADHSVNPFEW